MFNDENKIAQSRFSFADNVGNPKEVFNLLYHIERSPLAEYSVLYHFRMMLAKDGPLVRREIEECEKRQEQEE